MNLRYLLFTLSSLVIFATGVDFALSQGMGIGWNASFSSSVPILIPGAAVPQSEDNLHPALTRWSPSCLDASWGTGCNVVTQTCNAPSVGTPDQPCQPPQQLYPISATGNGTTATITYHSETNYAFTVGQPINIIGSTNWDTPVATVTTYSASTSGSCATAGHQCITLGGFTNNGSVNTPGCNLSASSCNFIPGDPVYIGGVAGNVSTPYSVATDYNYGYGWGQSITGGSYVTATGVMTVTIANPYFGASPTAGTNFVFRNLTGCVTGCPLAAQWALTSASGTSPQTLTFNLASGLTVSDQTFSAGNIMALSGQTGPNAKWTPDGTWSGAVTSLNIDINSAYPYGFSGAIPGGNEWGYDGTITQPWPVTASSCTNKTCTVSFLHPTACASSCVSATTQIVAGQFNAPIISWMTGPIVPYANENGTIEKCVTAIHVSPINFVKIALNGGVFTNATKMLDPWGVGAASNPNDPLQSSVTNTVYAYCAEFPASAVPDGLYELRAVACATVGPCSELTSALTAEATNGSSTLKIPAHNLQGDYRLAITQSQDSAFPTYDGRYQTLSSAIHATAATFSAGPKVTYTYAPGTATQPWPAGQVVNVVGGTTNNSCAITGGLANGNSIVYNYTGGCVFGVGSLIDVASVVVASQSEPIASYSYNNANGDLAITLSAALWGTSPFYANITQQTFSGVTGTNSNKVNGTKILQAITGSGTVLHIQVGAGLGTFSASGGNAVSNTYTWNGNRIPVTATNGSSTVTVAGMSDAAWSSGGTITEDWNTPCVVTSPTSVQITCPLPAGSASASIVTEPYLTTAMNLMCVVAGTSDQPAPYNPAYAPASTMAPNSIQVQYLLQDIQFNTNQNCTSNQNQGGCSIAPCGITATTNSTLWLVRKDAGDVPTIGSELGNSSGTPNDGSYFGYANAGGTITERSAYVNQWGSAASLTPNCMGNVRAAMSWNATRPSYAGAYCVNATLAREALYWGSTIAPGSTVANSGGCTTFTNAVYSFMSNGEPIVFLGTNTGTSTFTNWGLYWVKSGGGTTTLTLSATPGGACINELAANLSGVALEQDLGFKNIFFKCDHTAGCSTANPETVYAAGNGSGYTGTQVAKSAWLNYAPDTGNSTGQHDVELIYSQASSSTFGFGSAISQGGRVRGGLDRSWQDLTLTPALANGPTLSTTTATGGSLAGSAETLTFAAGVANFAGAKFQAPTATGGPGQNIVVSGLANNWNCGTYAAPCVVTSSTTTSVTFTNPNSPSGSFTPSGTPTIIPYSYSIEVAAGTFPNAGGANPASCTSGGLPIVPSGGQLACVANSVASPTLDTGLTNLWPFQLGQSVTSATLLSESNCMTVSNGGFAASDSSTVTNIIPSTGGGINDIIILTSFAANNPTWAYAPCTYFHFYNYGPFSGSGATDAWDSESTVIGGEPWEGAAGGANSRFVVTAGGGVSYVTNHMGYNSSNGFDFTGYIWGSSEIYNTGDCKNRASTSYHARCLGGNSTGPASNGLWDSRSPPTILHSYANYADYLASTPITCSDDSGATYHDCILKASSGILCKPVADCASGSTIFVMGDEGGGTIPLYLTVGSGIGANCGYYPGGVVTNTQPTVLSGSNSGSTDTITWMDKTSNALMVSSVASGSCDPITSVVAYYQLSYHLDLNFWSSGSSTGPAEFANRSPWETANNITIWDLDARASSSLLQMFTEGGIMMNVAVVDSNFQSNLVPIISGGTVGLDTSSYGSLNWMLLNDTTNQVSIPQFNYNGNAAPSYTFRAPYQDVYYIGLNAGTTMPGFPLSTDNNPNTGESKRALSFNTFNMADELTVLYSPLTFYLGLPLVPVGIWPSVAGYVDASGNPVLNSGAPNYYSLVSCPWYCAANDTGNSLQ